jgi:hypothetical protein
MLYSDGRAQQGNADAVLAMVVNGWHTRRGPARDFFLPILFTPSLVYWIIVYVTALPVQTRRQGMPMD